MYMKSTSNINKSQKSCLTGLFKLFVACSSWRILKHRLNHIFHCHLLRIFESFQHTSKIPTFTLLIRTNVQLHLKMLSYNLYFLKNLTDFRHIILQSAGNFLRENLIQNCCNRHDSGALRKRRNLEIKTAECTMIAWLYISAVIWAAQKIFSNIELSDRAKIHLKLFLL